MAKEVEGEEGGWLKKKEVIGKVMMRGGTWKGHNMRRGGVWKGHDESRWDLERP